MTTTPKSVREIISNVRKTASSEDKDVANGIIKTLRELEPLWENTNPTEAQTAEAMALFKSIPDGATKLALMELRKSILSGNVNLEVGPNDEVETKAKAPDNSNDDELPSKAHKPSDLQGVMTYVPTFDAVTALIDFEHSGVLGKIFRYSQNPAYGWMCCASVATLADDLNMSETKVKKIIKRLKQEGLIIDYGKNKKLRTRNYQVNDKLIKKLAQKSDNLYRSK